MVVEDLPEGVGRVLRPGIGVMDELDVGAGGAAGEAMRSASSTKSVRM